MQRPGLPEPISRLIDELSKLPGIGEKNATRLAFHIFRSSENYTRNLAETIINVKPNVTLCSVCYNFTSVDPCSMCTSQTRNNGIICVVEEPQDLIAIERSNEFNGQYHVLHGILSPIEGIGPEDLKIKELLSRIEDNKTSEIIIATNPSVEGEATALYLSKLIKPLGISVSRIAHGIPMGSDIEFIDEITLGKALKDRKSM